MRGLQCSSTPCLSGQRRDEDSGRVTVPKVAIQVNPTTTPIAELSERPHAARRGFIERPRLVSRLVETPEASVAVLIAPAGYGKSTLLSEWEQVDKRPFAWVMLDERHNDPTFLLGSITRSLNEIEPIDESVLAALTTSRPSIAKVVVPRLGEVLQERDRSFVLVLDDVHTVTDADALDSLTALTERIPSGSRLVLASRTRPPVKLGRLRADHRLLELDAADLLMTRLEARQTLRACGVEVSPEAADRIVGQDRGVAGRYLPRDGRDRRRRGRGGRDRALRRRRSLGCRLPPGGVPDRSTCERPRFSDPQLGARPALGAGLRHGSPAGGLG